MSQKTNLNVSPYYDDFDPNDNFYRVLFKPGFPVQSRELTSLQSILQNQVKSFGNHIFKDGSIVIPGNITYNPTYYAVKINPTHVGLSVGIYLDQLVGKKIKGQTSQITAVVQKVLKNTESETGDYTLYVKYITADANFSVSQFTDAETLIALDNVTYGNTTIPSGDTFATLLNSEATFTSSAVSISRGVYYIRGHFVDVAADTIVLDQYSNTPSYRVGLSVSETIVDAQDDNSLYDNARGFSNYAAPGADRLKISTKLSKKRITDTEDKDFIEILRVSGGVVKKIQDTNTYSEIKEYIAKRTFEESGNYAVDSFEVDVENSLNDRLGSDGVFFSNQITEQGNVPSENLLAVKVSPGKAYVGGFDVEKTSTTILDVDKPRATRTIPSASIPFEMGNKVLVNNVHGTPVLGLGNNFSVGLYRRRLDSDIAPNGQRIGDARIYSFALNDPADTFGNANKWDLYLYDIQTYTRITFGSNTSLTECPVGSHIRGLSSGATGYTTDERDSNGTIQFLTDTSGVFQAGEQVVINGGSVTRTISTTRTYGVNDIKSVYQNVNGGSTETAAGSAGLSTAFAADTILNESIVPGFSSADIITIDATAGIATVTGRNLAGKIKGGDILSYNVAGNDYPNYLRVVGITTTGTSATVASTQSVDGVAHGSLTSGNYTFKLASPSISGGDRAHLYAKLNSENISNVSFSGSNLVVDRQVSGKSTDNNGVVSIDRTDIGITSSFFEPYAFDRYAIFYSDGTAANLTADQVVVGGNSLDVTFSGLIPNQNNVFINASAKKNSITNKQKNYIRSEKKEISLTVSGVTTSVSGLTQNNNYGLRVEDHEISLNVPDVANVIAVYESLDNGSVILDKLTFSAGLNLNTSAILGEKIIGQGSGAVAQLVTKTSSTEVEFVYLNSNRFSPSETVLFEESNIRSAINSIVKGNYINKTQDYTLDKGQKEQYYDYSRIVRKRDALIPSKRLTIIYNCYKVPASDVGDVFSVNSYDDERYTSDIPLIGPNVRSTDTLDFRPRVAEFTSTTSSPFRFSGRDFGSNTSSPTLVVSPNETSILGYSYYLPRIDKVVITKNGQINLIKGVSSTNPIEPSSIDDSMDLATIELPAYLYNPDDAKVSLVNNRRYTMQDIRDIEQRLENVEELTSLTLLELDTKSLQIQDADGLSRFKSGFFVDSFNNTNFINVDSSDANSTVDTKKSELRSDLTFNSLKSQIVPAATENIDSLDFSSNFTLLDPNVRKTGDLVTLNYSSVLWSDIQQTFATKSQEINPFGVENYNGNVKLIPSADTWAKTLNPSAGVITRSQSNWNNTYISNLITSSNFNRRFRSRNIGFEASALQPSTNHFSFFGGSSNIDTIPKLLQVTMTSGSFQAGETVYAYEDGTKVAAFRLANANHKYGGYLNPSEVFTKNPYAPTLDIATVYSSSSPLINIDIHSLADSSIGRFYGYVSEGMTLVGETSSGQATVSSQSLTTDIVGDLIGCMFIRNPLSNPAPSVSFRTRETTFRLSTSSTNSNASDVKFTQATFGANGVMNSDVYRESIVVRKSPAALPLNALRRDPLSQTFRSDNTGGFLTKVDLYFRSKDSTEKVFLEIRETDIGGTPKDKLVQDFARVSILPSDITTSTDGSTATEITLPSPLYLQPNKQYSLTLSCPTSEDYEVWVGETNQPTIETQNYPNADQVVYSNQYTGGNLFKPQNGSVWAPTISEDLKFRLYKAEFVSTVGIAYFNNPSISIGSTFASIDANLETLTNNPIKTLPRKLTVGMSTSYALDDILTIGVQVAEGSNTGFIESVGGNINTIGINTTGIGYSNGTYNNVPLYTINGNGSGATANITVTNNGVSNVALAATGNGYRVGDLVGVTTASAGGVGERAEIEITAVPNIDTLYLTNVKGETFGTSQDLSYYSGSTLVAMAGTEVRGTPTVPDDIFSGNVIHVTHYNHGMQSNNNIVNISGVSPNTTTTTLDAAIISTNTTISVANTSNFVNFEGTAVSGTNLGYVLVNDEIISYSQVNVGSITINARGENESTVRNHAVDDIIRKYELNGISLTRINNSHNLPTDQSISSRRDIDSYHIQIQRPGTKNSGANLLNFDGEGSFGGDLCRATQNIQFNEVLPYFNVINPEGTSVSSTLRTVSGTSVGGNESSFQDLGYESVALNRVNELSSPRIVCSRVNETERLSTLPRSKSLTLGVRMETTNNSISPVIDLRDAATFVFGRNRLNNPVSNYENDLRIHSVSEDPHASAYLSNTVNLQQPAESLKVILTAYRNSSSDFRVLYKLTRSDSSEIDQTYELFNTDGTSDVRVRASEDGEYLEYEFTADNLPQFTGFAIKIVMSGTNEAYSTKFRDLRAIALV
jgi:hypothetical protein